MESMPAEYRDIDWDGLTHARRALIGNPFSTPTDDLARGEAWFRKNHIFVQRAMLGLCAVQRTGDARKLVLAAAHADARAGSTTEHLKTLCEATDWAHAKGMRLERAELARVGLALWRFQLAIVRLLGTSEAMRAIRQELWTLCFGPHLYDSLDKERDLRRLNVLILGETGTGKELLAETLQAAAFTTERPPVVGINCAALPRDLAEAELFGVERGAHSTAHQRRDGKLVAADGGTLFLDEVADLPPEVQVKLLSVIQNGKVTPLGSNEVRVVDVRYVAATSRPIHQLVKEDKFRQDLFERLAGHTIEVPALRNRPEDIVAIGEYLLRALRTDSVAGTVPGEMISNVVGGEAVRRMADEVWLQEARELPWHGNVRELERVLRQRAIGLRTRTPAAHVQLRSAGGDTLDVPPHILNCEASEEEVVEWYMRRVLEKAGGNQSQAQRILDIDRSTIRRRMEKLGLADPAPPAGTAPVKRK